MGFWRRDLLDTVPASILCWNKQRTMRQGEKTNLLHKVSAPALSNDIIDDESLLIICCVAEVGVEGYIRVPDTFH